LITKSSSDSNPTIAAAAIDPMIILFAISDVMVTTRILVPIMPCQFESTFANKDHH
jgi:hypothetical protein